MRRYVSKKPKRTPLRRKKVTSTKKDLIKSIKDNSDNETIKFTDYFERLKHNILNPQIKIMEGTKMVKQKTADLSFQNRQTEYTKVKVLRSKEREGSFAWNALTAYLNSLGVEQ